MNAPVNPIDNLRDIHLPADPGIWPPAIGWWIVAILSVIFFLRVLLGIFRWYRKAQQLKEFRDQIKAVSVEPLTTSVEKQSAVASLSHLVKRLCIDLLGRQAVASTHGQSLLKLLDQLSASKMYTSGPGELLAKGAYQPNSSGDVVALKNVILETLTRRTVLKNAREVTANAR